MIITEPELVEDDAELIKKINNENCSESFKKLFKKHEWVFYTNLKKYSLICQKLGIDVGDVIDEKEILMYKALANYNTAKSKFSSWFYTYTNYFFLNLLNAKNKHICVDFKKNQVSNDDFNSIFNLKSVIDFLETKDHILARIFDLRYNHGLTLEEVGKKLGIRGQTVLNKHNKALKMLKKEFKQ